MAAMSPTIQVRSAEEVSAKLDEAISDMENTAKGSEARVRAALLVRVLAWVLAETDSDPRLKSFDD